MKYSIGVDMGGTNTSIGLVDENAVDGWKQVSLGNGDKGWMKSSDIGIIGLYP